MEMLQEGIDFGEAEDEYGELPSDDDYSVELGEADAEDEDDDEEDDEVNLGEGEYAEFVDPISLGVGAFAARKLFGRRRRKVRRARPRRAYGRSIIGKRHGVVHTSAGRARVLLPGRFPTIRDFRRTTGEIQRDIKKNSLGIRDLVKAQKRDATRIAVLGKRSDKTLDRKILGLQVAVLALAALSIPQVRDMIRRFGA